MKYRPEIDGLRALAVVPVILFHAGDLLSGGFVGVDVFFVISGYLITTILIEDVECKNFSIIKFYERRARRILPALYIVTIMSTIAACIVLYPEYLVSFAKSLISTPLFLANFYFWSERGYFGSISELKPLIHFWSLAIEEQFYIVFPFFILLFYRFKKLFYSLLITGFFISICASFYLTQLHFDTAFYFPFTRAWELLSGSVAAIILNKHSINFKSAHADIISALGLVLIVFSYLSFDKTTPFPGVYAIIPVIGTFLFIMSASEAYYIKKIFSFKPIVLLGLLSFSLYLWHQPIFAFARHLNLFNGNFIELCLLILLFAYITYCYVEKPFRNKSFLSRKKIFLLSVFGAVILILIGGVIVFNKGFPKRYNIEDRALLTQLSEYKGYNQRIFDSLEQKPFDLDSKYRVVIIGDSYAKDLMNIIKESKLFPNVQFSTRQVNSECGNLYLKNYNLINKYIPKNRIERCELFGWYNGVSFKKVLNEADEIWLASSWKKWVIEFLPQSLGNLSHEFGVPIRIFGIKNFGAILPYELISLPHRQRVNFTQQASAKSIEVAIKLHAAMENYEFFYPLLKLLCGGDYYACKIFTDEGLLISADGKHLTKEGAIESADRLRSILTQISSSLKKK